MCEAALCSPGCCGQVPGSTLIYLNLLPPTSQPSFFIRALEVKALSVWLSCTWEVIMASLCRGPGGALLEE